MQSHTALKDKTITEVHPPLLNRRSVLLNHLAAILDSASPSSVCQELEALSDEELMEMLQQREKLEKFATELETKYSKTSQCETSHADFEVLGNLLFDKVAKIETELCAQITGMLLELDRALIEQLLSDDTALRGAVTRAKEKYLKEKHPTLLAPGDGVSDAVYKEVHMMYPQNAPQITGMLLELPPACIHHLLHSPTELTERIQEARQALEQVGKWTDE